MKFNKFLIKNFNHELLVVKQTKFVLDKLFQIQIAFASKKLFYFEKIKLLNQRQKNTMREK